MPGVAFEAIEANIGSVSSNTWDSSNSFYPNVYTNWVCRVKMPRTQMPVSSFTYNYASLSYEVTNVYNSSGTLTYYIDDSPAWTPAGVWGGSVPIVFNSAQTPMSAAYYSTQNITSTAVRDALMSYGNKNWYIYIKCTGDITIRTQGASSTRPFEMLINYTEITNITKMRIGVGSSIVTPKEAYVGVSGPKKVKEIYIGAGGGVKKIYP